MPVELDRLSDHFRIVKVDFQTMLSVIGACEDMQQVPDFVDATKTGLANRPDPKGLSLLAIFKGIIPGKEADIVSDIERGRSI